eukprot:g17007.t1
MVVRVCCRRIAPGTHSMVVTRSASKWGGAQGRVRNTTFCPEVDFAPRRRKSSSPKASPFKLASKSEISADAQPSSVHSNVSPTSDKECMYGFSNGEKFVVPDTCDTVSYFSPQNISCVGACTLTFIVLQFLLASSNRVPTWVLVSQSIFWRLAYNVFLGFLLALQSNHGTLTRIYIHFTDGDNQNSLLSRFFKYLASLGYANGATYDVSQLPPALNAWMCFRHLVVLILTVDVACFLGLGLRFFRWPTFLPWPGWGLLIVGQYILALALWGLFYWAKVDAHRCIGDYCWFWGDFFFRSNASLTFDGIFDHLCQMAFLYAVEEPHIERTYGPGSPKIEELEESCKE